LTNLTNKESTLYITISTLAVSLT